MNKQFIKSNISEAIEELQRIIEEIDQDDEYSEPEFSVAMEHAFHHLNFAWHIRNVSENEAGECSEDNFKKWSKFPVGELLEYE